MSKFYSQKITPMPMPESINVVDLVDHYFTAYNSARLRETCQLLARQVFQPGVTVGLSLSGALTPAGFGVSAIAPLMRAGFIDWIISTGANLYHDMHYGLGLALYASNPFVDDVKLRQEGRIRIYDIVFDYDVLLSTDAFLRQILQAEPFQKRMGTAEFHYLLGKYVYEIEQQVGVQQPSLLSTAYECGVPIYTSSPGDSSIGMNVAAVALDGNDLFIDPMIDVNETAAIAYAARQTESGDVGKSAAIILGGGSPKNFLLQTQPQLHEVLGLEERGHDFFIQITDARPDTGGLSGATPSEAVSWGKVDPEELPSAIVCYTDSTIALPILTAYTLNQSAPRPLKRLYDRRDAMMDELRRDYNAAKKTAATLKSQAPALSIIDKSVIDKSVSDSSGLEKPVLDKPILDPVLGKVPEKPVATYPCGTPIRR
ncbi:deoxyhypusine synthase [Alkalinema sp. FACHB-956]|uniref:homospermidine biosynthesis protein n=1 Tax=Alkalinema sp. FACHB-956 TaxID=2692768 RepID=UPI001684ED68|nr:deoxyhypusine synthase [Alkalinema sp. FACHB-956]MBD2326133.1 deoxyhypusine synthase [Alkalinema sp. FACHB-956]